MGRLFGTDGVRGVAGSELTCQLAYELGQAAAFVLTQKCHHPRIIVGRDTRLSGDALEAALIAGIYSVGAHVILAGRVPTPTVAFLTRYWEMDAGIVITASHNPMEYNGIKILNKQGYKLSDALEERIESIVLDHSEPMPVMAGAQMGRRIRMPDLIKPYTDYLLTIPKGSLTGIKVVIDCANGAAWRIAPTVLHELGAQVSVIHNQPDGININQQCGSTYPESLQQEVIRQQADIGLAFDGDADRLIAVDHEGNLIDGDQMLMVCALDLKCRGLLPQDTIVVTVLSNLGLMLAAEREGIHVETTAVGDRYVLERMVEGGFILGGEQSGHVIFLDHNSTGDGMVTALHLMDVMVRSGKTLKRLSQAMQIMPQVLVNARINSARRADVFKDPEIASAVATLQAQYDGHGRVLIRPSGTEPLVRVMIEGYDRDVIAQQASSLAQLIEARLSI